MTSGDLVTIIAYVVGTGGLTWWARKWFTALNGAIKAQEDAIKAQERTIDAQKVLMQGMADFLNLADTPKMAERFKAYREITDAEKDALIKKYEHQLNEQMKSYQGLTPLLSEALFSLAIYYKLHPLDWETLKPTYSANLSQWIELMMEALPPYSPSPRPTLKETLTSPPSPPPFAKK